VSDASDITGVWQGLYVYDWGRSEAFVATLLQFGDHLGGTTHERAQGKTRYATIDGRLAGSAVFFRKTYDGACGWGHTVVYSGRLSSDGLEIDGEWRIAPHKPGRFLMIRQGRSGEAAERRVSVDADV
jgi:hypothetical protein